MTLAHDRWRNANSCMKQNRMALCVQQRLGDTSLNGVTCLAALWSHWVFFNMPVLDSRQKEEAADALSEIYSLSLQQVCWVEGTIVCFFYDQWTFWGVIKKNFNLLYHTPRLDLSFSDWHVSLTAGRKPPAHVLCNVCQCHCWTFGQSKGGRGTY